MARRATVLLLALTVLLCSACGAATQTYEGLSFELPKGFIDLGSESYADTYDFLYSDGVVAVAGIRETRQALSAYYGPLTAEQYARLVVKLNGLACEPMQQDGLWRFSYEAVSGGIPMTYLCVIHETEDSFWQVQAYCATADLPAQEASMWKLLTSMDAG